MVVITSFSRYNRLKRTRNIRTDADKPESLGELLHIGPHPNIYAAIAASVPLICSLFDSTPNNVQAFRGHLRSSHSLKADSGRTYTYFKYFF